MKKITIPWFISLAILCVLAMTKSVLAGIEEIDLSAFDIALKIALSCFIAVSIFFCILFVYQSNSYKKITNGMSNQELIEFWLEMREKPGKLFLIHDKNTDNEFLGTLYLMENNVDESRKCFSLSKRKKPTLYSIYPQFVLAAYDENKAAMDKYYKALMKANYKVDVQKDSATKIKEMIENKRYDARIYEETSYEVIRNICLRYKK